MLQFDGCFETACDGCQISSCAGCSFDDPFLVPLCTDVMEYSNSSGGMVTPEKLWIEPGYWRATETSTDILACYNGDACLGGVTPGYCLNGYGGPCERRRLFFQCEPLGEHFREALVMPRCASLGSSSSTW